MRAEFVSMQLPGTAGNQGPAIRVEDHGDFTVDVKLDGAGSVTIEGTLDGTNWYAIGAAIIADGITSISGTYRSLRVDHTTQAGNNARVLLGMRYLRGH